MIRRIGRWEWPLGAAAIVVDRAFAQLLGFDEHELSDRIDDWRRRLGMLDLAAAFAAWSALTGTLRGDLPIMHAELPLWHKDGRIRWLLLRGSLSPGSRSGARCLTGTALDITRLKLADQPFATRDVRPDTTLGNGVPDTLLLIHEDGATLRIRGLLDPLLMPRPHIVTTGALPLALPRRLAAEFQRQASRVRATGEPASLRYDLNTAGQRRTYDTRFLAGADNMVVGIARDVSGQAQMDEMNRLRAQLTIATRLQVFYAPKVQLLHQISQPLTAIVMNAQAAQKLARAAPPRLEAMHEALDDIVAAANRSRAELAAVRRELRGRVEARQAVAINQVIQDALALVRPRLEAHHIMMAAELATDLPMVRAERGQLQIVVVNLLTNAVDALAEAHGARKVTVRSWRGEQDVLVTVSDTGQGIRSIDLERVFSRFYTTKPEGMGVGLWLSRAIVDTLGGHLRALPGVAMGATFEMNLPAEDF
jgi:signal transduction histidine kinase